MSNPDLREFDQFRFIREEDGSLATLPTSQGNETLLLVLDCDRLRLGRLHIFQGAAAADESQADWFSREMTAVGRLRHPALAPILGFGRDDTELFYADPVVDGEPVRDYLKRNGPLPPGWALRLALELIDVLSSERALPRTLENFTVGNLFLKARRDGGLSLVFTDYAGWDKPCLVRESQLVEKVALSLYSLLAGTEIMAPPTVPFHHEAADVPDGVKDLIGAVMPEGRDLRSQRMGHFRVAVEQLIAGLPHPGLPPAPRRLMRDWLLKGADDIDLGYEYKRPEKSRVPAGMAAEAAYAFDAVPNRSIVFSGVRFQLFPSDEALPREIWLEQHQSALRRSGRGLPNQLGINVLIPRERALLIGEEPVEGLNLNAIVEHLGPMEPRHAVELGGKLNAALDAIEKTAGSTPVWWLPAENVYVVTGGNEISSLREALNHFGANAWQRLPVRLRLHQTALSLFEGIGMPGDLAERMRQSAKGDGARRTAVLLPLLWYAVTGERFSWHDELKAPPGLPVEIAALFSDTRRRLLDEPDAVRGLFLEKFAALLPEPASQPPASGSVIPAAGGLIDDGVIGEGFGVPEAKNPEPTEKESATPATAGSSGPKSSWLANFLRTNTRNGPPPEKKVESLGVIDDSGLAESKPAIRPARTPKPASANGDHEGETGEVESLGVIDDSMPFFDALEGDESDRAEPAAPTKRPAARSRFLEAAKALATATAANSLLKPLTGGGGGEKPGDDPANLQENAGVDADPEPAPTEDEEFVKEILAETPPPETATLPAEAKATVEMGEVETESESKLGSASTEEPEAVTSDPGEGSEEGPPDPEASERSAPVDAVAPEVMEEISGNGGEGARFLAPAFSSRKPAEPEPQSKPESIFVAEPENVAEVEIAEEGAPGSEPLEESAIVEAGEVDAAEAEVSTPSISIEERAPAGSEPEAAPSNLVVDETLDTVPELKSESESRSESIPHAEAAAEFRPDPEPEAEPEFQSATEPDSEPEPESVSGSGSVAVSNSAGGEPQLLPEWVLQYLPEHQRPAPPAPAPARRVSGLSEPETVDNPEADAEADAGPTLFGGAAASVYSPAQTGFGERLLSHPGDPAVAAAGRKTAMPWSRVIAFAAVAALVLWLIAFAVGKGNAIMERQVFSETLEEVVYAPRMMLGPEASEEISAADLGSGDAPTGQITVTGSEEKPGRDPATVEKASEAIQLGDAARDEGRYGDAMNLYLRALDLEPASSEARTQLWQTLEAWSKSGERPVASHESAGRLEKAVEYAPQAAWVLAEYYLERDRALALRWLTESAKSGYAPHQVRLGLILAEGKWVPEDLAGAVEWFRQAAENGSVEGKFYYAEALV
ncbi:MAG: hypothetical protein KDM91_04925, partial [Verrucomicrobiae bacterium]|nr:hypothetical protein [Verrucomicrobiae bacterium]